MERVESLSKVSLTHRQQTASVSLEAAWSLFSLSAMSAGFCPCILDVCHLVFKSLERGTMLRSYEGTIMRWVQCHF